MIGALPGDQPGAETERNGSTASAPLDVFARGWEMTAGADCTPRRE